MDITSRTLDTELGSDSFFRKESFLGGDALAFREAYEMLDSASLKNYLRQQAFDECGKQMQSFT